MSRMIDVDALDEAMYHKSFEVDDGRQQWNSGLWIRYKIYEEASREAPTVDAVPVEWIEKWLERYSYRNYQREIIEFMVTEWKHEQEKADE